MRARLWKILAAAVVVALLAACNLPLPTNTPVETPPDGTPTILPPASPSPTGPGGATEPAQQPSPTTTVHQDNRAAVFPITHYIESVQPAYTIDVVFPTIPALGEQHAFNADIASLVEQIEALFTQAAGPAPGMDDPPPSGLRGRYELFAATQGLISVRMSFSEYYSGAAHPNPYTITLNYLLRDDRALELSELFQPGMPYLERIAEQSRAQLEPTGVVIFPDGFDPVPDNYRNWNVSDDGLIITFDVYQVSPYAAGPQTVTIPWEQFSDMQAGGNPLAALLAEDPLVVNEPAQEPGTTPIAAQTLDASLTRLTVAASIHPNLPPFDLTLAGRPADIDGAIAYESITVERDGQTTQVIDGLATQTPSGTEFVPLVVEDMDFDGYADLRLISYQPASGNVPYFYWLYEPASGLFVRNTDLEPLLSPEFDPAAGEIRTRVRESASQVVLETYVWQDGAPYLVRRETRDFNGPGTYTATIEERVDGVMVITGTVEGNE